MATDPRAPLAPHSRAPVSQPPAFLEARPAWRRVRLCLLALLALLAAFAGSGGMGGASTTPASAHTISFKVLGAHGLAPLQAQAAATTQTGPLVPQGGPVQDHPQVYLVFWGPNWNQDTAGVRLALMNLFNSLAGGNYNNILSQYTGNRGASANYLHTNSVLAGWAIDTTNPLPNRQVNLTDIGYEAVQSLNDHSWANTANTQVLVYPQQGTQYPPDFDDPQTGFCGDHYLFGSQPSTNVVVGMVRYTSDPVINCYFGGTSVADSMTKVAAHEYAEMATDPNPDDPAWLGTGGLEAEIGDLCNDDLFTYHPTNTMSFSIRVQKLWSNITNQCEQAVGAEYVSAGPPGKHTVQLYILTKYQSTCGTAGACVSVLGAPATEEIPIAGGAVSYFSGKCGSGTTRGPGSSCSAIYYGATGAQAIWGNDFQKYIGPCGTTGQTCVHLLGLPMNDPKYYPNGGAVSYFPDKCGSRGPDSNHHCSAIYDNAATGAHAIWGDDYRTYVDNGGAGGILGFPTSDPIYLSGGAVSYFHGGTTDCPRTDTYHSCSAIYSSNSGLGTFVVTGSYYQVYTSIGGPNSLLGFPTSIVQTITGGKAQNFQGGYIWWNSSTGTTQITWFCEVKQVNGCV